MQPALRMPRSIDKSARQMARGIVETEDIEIPWKLRKKVAMPFANLKCILRLGRLRRQRGALDEFPLAVAAQKNSIPSTAASASAEASTGPKAAS
jgi:hypothetical protein